MAKLSLLGKSSTEYLSAYANNVQTLSGGDNDITFDVIVNDPSSSYNTGTGEFTITKAGIYLVRVSCVYDGGTANDIYDIKLNGSVVGNVSINGSSTYADGGGTARFAGMAIAKLSVNEIVKIVIYYAGGDSPAQNNAGESFNTFSITRLP